VMRRQDLCHSTTFQPSPSRSSGLGGEGCQLGGAHQVSTMKEEVVRLSPRMVGLRLVRPSSASISTLPFRTTSVKEEEVGEVPENFPPSDDEGLNQR
jgi:hypothetical protein